MLCSIYYILFSFDKFRFDLLCFVRLVSFCSNTFRCTSYSVYFCCAVVSYILMCSIQFDKVLFCYVMFRFEYVGCMLFCYVQVDYALTLYVECESLVFCVSIVYVLLRLDIFCFDCFG